MRAVARAALLGARGNSGVILSQIVRGAAEELASRPGELVDPVLVAAAFARAADAAYESVRDPAEGTMLSAVRAMAHRVAQDLAHMEKARLEQGASEDEQDELLADVLERALEAANEAVERGPEQLPVLKEAGVVDAGAYGLTAIVVGVIAALRGGNGPVLAHQIAPTRAMHLPQHESSEYRYCTNFAVTGQGLDAREFIPMLEQIGDCVLVVGDQATLKVHVHTDEPDLATSMFVARGAVSHFDVADMHEQVADRSARLEVGCSPVVVATGDGLVRMFRELGAHVVEGGPTMNPSTYDILAGIHSAPGSSAVVLPNSPNVILAAERAAELSEKDACVVATRSQQQALTALLAFDGAVHASANAERLREAADGRAHRRSRARGARGPRRQVQRRRRRRLLGRRPDGVGRPRRGARADHARRDRGLRGRHVYRGRRCTASPRCGRARGPGGHRARLPRGRPALVVVAAVRRVASPSSRAGILFASGHASPNRMT